MYNINTQPGSAVHLVWERGRRSEPGLNHFTVCFLLHCALDSPTLERVPLGDGFLIYRQSFLAAQGETFACESMRQGDLAAYTWLQSQQFSWIKAWNLVQPMRRCFLSIKDPADLSEQCIQQAASTWNV